MILRRRLCTIFLLTVRYCHDGTSTWDRMINPELYHGRKTTRMDKFDMWAFRMFPNCKDYSDFQGQFPYPYRLWDGIKVPSYVYRTFPATLLSAGPSIVIALGFWREKLPWILIGILLCYEFLAILTILCRGWHWLNRLLFTRIKYLNLRPSEIIYAFSLHTLSASGRFKTKRVLPLMLLVWVCIVSLYKGYNLDLGR